METRFEPTQYLVQAAADALLEYENGPDLTFAAGDWEAVFGAAYRWFRAFGKESLEDLSQNAPDSVTAGEKLLNECPDRLAMLVADALTTNSIAPPVCISLTPVHLDTPYGAVVFAAFPRAIEELAPLLVDGLEEQMRSRRFSGVVAIHDTWMQKDGYPERILRLDAENNVIVEQGVLNPCRPERILLLLGPGSDEATWHRRWHDVASNCGIDVANPYEFAYIADDKWQTFHIWQNAGVPTPVTRLVPPDTAFTAEMCLSLVDGPSAPVVAKPRHGTEGLAATVCNPAETTAPLKAIWERGDDAVLQPFTNDLVWVEEAGEAHTAVLRMNVTCNAQGASRVESGFVHVAARGCGIASAGHQGRLRPIVRSALRVRVGGGLAPFPAHLAAQCEACACAAVDAVAATSRKTRLAGVDVVVCAGDGGMPRALALEVNPRPAGLSHSRFLSAGWETEGEPGVSRFMWGE
ncbi:MAG TPA: ATP-grasp domain-containing protein [Candidatus Latescibacteria bacterium]|nr:ATP-grasp domain-containing protein [Candidatus Latescibacterota bacterium]